jgi:hypothetical protein
MNNKLLDALRARNEAKKLEALATIDVYLNNAAGIGEHPQVVEEMDKQLEALAAADDNLEALKHYYDEG